MYGEKNVSRVNQPILDQGEDLPPVNHRRRKKPGSMKKRGILVGVRESDAAPRSFLKEEIGGARRGASYRDFVRDANRPPSIDEIL